MMKFEMTYHAQVERLDRLVKCIELVGVGDVILTAENIRDYQQGTIRQLTSTGLILVVNPTTNALVTGYMGTLKQVSSIYKDNGYQKMPNSMYKQVKRNTEKYSFLLEM